MVYCMSVIPQNCLKRWLRKIEVIFFSVRKDPGKLSGSFFYVQNWTTGGKYGEDQSGAVLG